MKHGTTLKRLPITPEETTSAIEAAPDCVNDLECPYDPNDPAAVDTFWKDATVRRPGQRGPGKRVKKVQLSVWYSPEVVEYFKAAGEGWQTRMDDALREWMASRQRD